MTPQSIRILVIEDEAAHAEAISRSVEAMEGVELRVMTTLREYRELGEDWNPDLALMDLNLPDGQALEVLPDPSGSRSFAIIVMTSYGSEKTAVEAMKSGAFDYLVKSPETFSGLSRTLEWLLRKEGRRMDRELKTSEAKYRSLAEGSSDFIMRFDRQGRNAYMNSAGLKMLGLSDADVIGKSPRECGFPEDLYVLLETQIQKVFATAEPAEVEFEWDRSEVPVVLDMRLTPEFEVEGQVHSVLCVGRDITERRQAEAERRQLDERMSQIQKLEALGVLVAGVAHNINNVLAAIMGTASLRERLASEPAELEACRIIGTACKRGRDVVKSLMQFAQPTLSNQAPLEIHSLVSELRILLENTTRNRIQILELFCPEPLWVLGDAGGLSNALMNLCLNAMDAMPGGGTLTLRTAVPEAGWIELSVEDSGEGMSPEVLTRALEPFFTTKPVGKGTGLGLSMTSGVIKAHGGTLEIASQPGQGTRVRLRIPRIPTPPAQAPFQPTPQSLGLVDVLLVDDDADVRFLVTRMLKVVGVHVHSVAGGEAALEWLGRGIPPDLIILDQNMPGMTGVQTMEKIREKNSGVPILISSGQPDIEHWPCFRHPNVAVIAKPFDMEEILAKLMQFAATLNPGSEGQT